MVSNFVAIQSTFFKNLLRNIETKKLLQATPVAKKSTDADIYFKKIMLKGISYYE
jgi:hypothetical protein